MTIQAYYFYNKTTGDFESGRQEITAGFLERHSKDGWELKLLDAGEQVPSTLTHTIDPSSGVPSLRTLALAENPVSFSRRMKNSEMDAVAYANITTHGFRSSTLSATKTPLDIYFYPSDETSQRNQLIGGMLMCQAPDGSWARRLHTEEQRQQVVASFHSMRDTVLMKLDTARANVAAAITIEQIATVVLS